MELNPENWPKEKLYYFAREKKGQTWEIATPSYSTQEEAANALAALPPSQNVRKLVCAYNL